MCKLMLDYIKPDLTPPPSSITDVLESEHFHTCSRSVRLQILSKLNTFIPAPEVDEESNLFLFRSQYQRKRGKKMESNLF